MTSYSFSSSDNYRSIVQAEQFTPDRVRETEVEVFNGESPDAYGIDDIRTCPLGYFACGAKVRYDSNGGVSDGWDGEGIFELAMRCCNGNDWQDQRDVTVRGRDDDRRDTSQYYLWAPVSGISMCPTNFYVTGGSVKYSDKETAFGVFEDDPLGIVGLKLTCTGPKDASVLEKDPPDLKEDVDFVTEEVTVLNGIDSNEERPTFAPAIRGAFDGRSPQLAGYSFPTVIGMGVNYVTAQGVFTSTEGYGIDGLKFKYQEKKPNDGVQVCISKVCHLWVAA